MTGENTYNVLHGDVEAYLKQKLYNPSDHNLGDNNYDVRSVVFPNINEIVRTHFKGLQHEGLVVTLKRPRRSKNSAESNSTKDVYNNIIEFFIATPWRFNHEFTDHTVDLKSSYPEEYKTRGITGHTRTIERGLTVNK